MTENQQKRRIMTAASDIAALAATDVREPIPMDKLIPVLSSPPFIPSRSLINIRDAGLVPGSALPANRIYRCGALDLAAKDPEAVAWLAANVKRVFDLRRTIEREAAPDPEVPGVENVWLKGHDGEELPRPSLQQYADEGGASVWREQYMSIAMVYRPTIKALLEHVRDRPEEPFLFHCTAGRDRTGVVAGLLHHLAGTPPEAATGDYMLSRLGTEPARDKLIHFAFAMAGTDDINAPGFHDLVSLKPEYWEAFVGRLTEKYGGWDGYVTEALGFSAEDLAKMKKNLRP